MRYVFEYPAHEPGATCDVFAPDGDHLGTLTRHVGTTTDTAWVFSFQRDETRSRRYSNPRVAIDALLFPDTWD